ncbi:predicted protein, partial [Arabidopsis lyrata subsp. lyrata]
QQTLVLVILCSNKKVDVSSVGILTLSLRSLEKQNVGSLHGFMHKYLKHMVLSLFGHESLKKMLPEIEQSNSNELKDSVASLIFDLTAKKLISHDTEKSSENLREYFVAFIHGLISFPIDIPGTAYHKCLKGRESAMKMLRNMLQERCEKPRENPSDFFDYVIEELKKEGTILTEAIALDLMFALLFASFETTSLSLTLAIKFLSDNPSVLKRLTEEHEEILGNREDADSGLTWKEYKSMTIHISDDIIPANWAVMVCPPAIHLNPNIYEDPLVFNPSRWEGSETTNASKNFMAFGGGIWEEISGGNILRTPGLQFPNGYHVKLKKKEI